MKLFSVLASALLVAAFAASMPTPKDASDNDNNNMSTNTSEVENIESRMRESWEELVNPLHDHPYVKDHNLTTPFFYATERMPDSTIQMEYKYSLHLEEVKLIETDSFKCLDSNHSPWFPRFSWQFKGYCEDDYGQCFLRALRKRGAIAHNWQCWKRDDGWWQADYTHFHAYLAAIPVLDESLAEIIGFEPHCE
ncbi:unnamed protein product [Clonostachys rosea]|uniref:Uncharacterized protein n=1 Tax=Bionectria ochroleuca TaxID=29856 RepID=A0ABY6UD18_BIOOC|nr:unnamed protein product [Clonostachys rosea]